VMVRQHRTRDDVGGVLDERAEATLALLRVRLATAMTGPTIAPLM